MRKFLFPVVLFWLLVACSSQTAESTPTAPAKPDVEYEILNEEDYGTADHQGKSYRILAPADTTNGQARSIATYETYLKQQPDQAELTFFFYLGRNPEDDGNWAADRTFVWSRETGNILQQ